MNRNRKIKVKKLNKPLAIGMAALMGAVPMVTAAPVFADSAQTSDSAVTKDETVYVNADASGKTSKITVSDQLTNAGSQKTVEDASDLSDIQNVKGDETYSGSGSNMTWTTDGEDIFYQGTSNKDLPVGVSFTYLLDGKEIAPKDLIGKSGKLTIKIKYTNNTSTSVDINGKKQDVQTPFMMITGLIMPSETFSNVTVDNGKVINDGSRNVVVAYGMPGLRESLNIDGYTSDDSSKTTSEESVSSTSSEDSSKEASDSSASSEDSGKKTSDNKDSKSTEDKIDEKTQTVKDKIADINIPDTVEITADVTDFEMSSTYTVAMDSIFDDIDVDDIEDSDDLRDSLNELEDAAVKLADGSSELKDGTSELATKYKDLDSGISCFQYDLLQRHPFPLLRQF